MDIKAVVVRPMQVAEAKSYGTMNALLRDLGISPTRTPWQTNEIGIDGLGLVVRDQDHAERLKQNRLGMKGSFAILGMERRDGVTIFRGLTDNEVNDVRGSLLKTSLVELGVLKATQ